MQILKNYDLKNYFWEKLLTYQTQSDSIKQVKDWTKYKISYGLELVNTTLLKSRYT